MRDENSLYWIWLSEKCGIASKDFGRLMVRYDDPFDLYRLEEEEIERLEGISPALKQRLADKSLESAYSVLRYCKQKNIDVIAYSDPRYPSRLRTIEDPPVILYSVGEFPDMNNSLCVGIVGTRRMSEYGRESAYKISYELASANAVIVSGMALGIDGVAACGALASGGKTVAVLGCGVSVVYPKEHAKLMREIAKRGAVVSEFSPFERPVGANFPKRNRIISGLCQGVVVIEGAIGSGALITANRAISQGRELFALPGKINESNSDGPNELIKNGARVALGADDIILHYDFLYHDTINYGGLRRAKSNMIPVESSVKKYGVSSVYKKKLLYKKDEPENANEDAPADVATATQTEDSAQTPQTVAKDTSAAPSEELLGTLDPLSRRVFEAMPAGRAINLDQLAIDGVDVGEIITSLTMLEISGLVDALPGGMYKRK